MGETCFETSGSLELDYIIDIDMLQVRGVGRCKDISHADMYIYKLGHGVSVFTALTAI